MLTSLSIKNFALLEDVSLDFSAGLNVLTGETGAGKTIVIEALGLALGDKASAQQVRKGSPRLTVTAVFETDSPRAKKLLKDLDLEGKGDAPSTELRGQTARQSRETSVECLMRREVDASGRSRGFVNDRPVGIGTLSQLGELLAYVHGQNEHQLLLKPTEQRDLLDAFGRLESQRESVSTAYLHWRELLSEQQATSLSEQERAQRIDLYRFQSQELQAAKLRPDEEDELERLLPQLKNAERIKNLSREAYGHLYGDEGSALEKIRRVQRGLESLQSQGADLNAVVEMVQEAVVRLEEAAQTLDTFQNRVDLDPDRLDEFMTRLDQIARLKKKYGPTLAEVLTYQKKIEEELRYLENVEEKKRDISEKLAIAEKSLKETSGRLSLAREAAAKKLSAAVEKEFRDLGLDRAEFEVSVQKNAEGSYSAAGSDTVEYRFSPNPGEGAKSLSAVASGGELSRVMLALETVLAKADAVPVLIFDEIDAGVGGELGGAVGKKLARLGKNHQVLSITHLAAIAACAQNHFAVNKEVRKDRTHTAVRRLTEEERVAEIARLFGGVSGKAGPDSISLKHARELLAEAKS